MVYTIVIDATIGAGKSSIISELKNDYTCFLEPVEEWSLLQNFYEDMSSYAAPFQFQVLFSFHKMYSNFKNVKDKVIVERCPWSSKNIFTKMMVENGHISNEEYMTYCNFYNKIAFTTDLFIYLKVDTDVAYRRILNRDRASERTIKFEYLEILNQKYNEAIKLLPNVKIVDANRSLIEVKSQVVNILNQI
jgi:deoxyadenosine/deoxycytidine kinase